MARLTASALLLLAAACQTYAQDEAPPAPAPAEDLTLPPVIGESPGDVRLEPAHEEREDEIVVEVAGGQSDWRLPDLGTSLRREEEPELDQRMEFRLAPLYDPEKQVEMLEPVPVVDVLRDVGFLRIFEVGFGRRSPQN